MIQDMLEMPFAYNRDIAFDNVIPLFLTHNGMDVGTAVVGSNIEIDKEQLKQTYRYKILEYVGDYLVERVLLSTKPIDINSDWSKSDIEIYPLYAIMRNLKKFNEVIYERYLPGIWNALNWFDQFPENLETIHSVIDRRLCTWWPIDKIHVLPLHDLHRQVIRGNSCKGIDEYITVLGVSDPNVWCSEKEMQEMREDPNKITHADEEISINTAPYIKDVVTLKDLNHLKTKCSGLWCINQTSGKPTRLFDVNKDTVKFNIGTEKNYHQLKLIEYLSTQIFTDIYLNVSVVYKPNDQWWYHSKRKHKKFNIKECDILNRYQGLHIDKNNMSHTTIDDIDYLLDLVAEVYGVGIINVEILKNWWDELYIRITLPDNKVEEYFYDLTWLVLTDTSVMDAND